jgi:hypothetical protein
MKYKNGRQSRLSLIHKQVFLIGVLQMFTGEFSKIIHKILSWIRWRCLMASPFDELREVEQKVFSSGFQVYQAEIVKDKYDDPSLDPVEFAKPANTFGAILIANFNYELADRYFDQLAARTLNFRDSTGKRRHAGSFYANRAVARARMGDIRGALALFDMAMEEDKQNYGVERDKTHAMIMLKEMLANGKKFALRNASSINPRIDETAIETLCHRLDRDENNFLLILHDASEISKADASKISGSVLASERLKSCAVWVCNWNQPAEISTAMIEVPY